MLKLVIPGNPIAKSRPRFRRCGNFVQTYDNQAAQMKQIKQNMVDLCGNYAKQALKYSICIKFYLEPHGSDINKKLWGFVGCTQKNDIDNLIKTIFDCGNGILWDDDSKIVRIKAFKKYSDNPRTEVTVIPLEEHVSGDALEIIATFSPSEMQELSNDVCALKYHIERLNNAESLKNICYENTSNCLKIFATKYDKQFAKIKKIAKRMA